MTELTKLFNEVFYDCYYPTIGSEPKPIHKEIELAGVKKDEIKISLDNDCVYIRISNKRKQGSSVFSISKNHDIDKAIIKYEDGLLEIDVPLKEIKKQERVLEWK